MSAAYGSGKNKDSGSPEFLKLKKLAKEKRLQGVFLFWGEEEYTKDHYAGLIRALVKDAPLPEFVYVPFDAEKLSPSDLADAIDTPPMMWDRKVVEIRGLRPGKCSVEDGEQYARLLESVPDEVTVLILLRADDMQPANSRRSGSEGTGDDGGGAAKGKGKRGNGFDLVKKAVEAHGLAVEFTPGDGEHLKTWIERHFAARKVRFSPGVPETLLSYCGSDMYTLQSEIGKLCDAAGDAPLTECDVKTYCCSNESSVFYNVAVCMNNKDVAGARKILQGIRFTAETVPMSMGYLAGHYQLMLAVRAGLNAGKTLAQISSEIKFPLWRVNNTAKSLTEGNVSWERLRYAADVIAETDERIKNRRINPSSAMELMIYKICSYDG